MAHHRDAYAGGIAGQVQHPTQLTVADPFRITGAVDRGDLEAVLALGATRIIEGWGDDVPRGTQTDFYRAVEAKDDETVAFSWVEWPDKATRDAGMQKMMEDPRMDPSNKDNPPMPFDGQRMVFGGFTPVVELRA